MKKLISAGLIFIALGAFSVFTNAQNKMSEEKRKLIAELITVTKADEQYFKITDAMLDTMEKTYPLIVEQSIQNNTTLSAAEKQRLADMTTGRFKMVSQKFREKLPQKINAKKFVEDLIYPLYDKFYTEKELSDLVTFYKTPTGQKLIDSTPKLVEESGAIAQRELLPQILVVAEEIMKEVFPELSEKPPAPPPAAVKEN